MSDDFVEKRVIPLIADQSEIGIVLLNEDFTLRAVMNRAARTAFGAEGKAPGGAWEQECSVLARSVSGLSRGGVSGVPAAFRKVRLNGRGYLAGTFPFIVQSGSACRLFFYLYLCPVVSGDEEQDRILAVKNRYSLSQRETQVLQKVVDGQSNRQISQQLGISIHTVKRHIENIYDKMQIHGRKMLVTSLVTA